MKEKKTGISRLPELKVADLFFNSSFFVKAE